MDRSAPAPDLSIVIPAFNEEARLPDSLSKLAEFIESEGRHAEIIVADDGSLDDTARVVERWKDRGVLYERLPANRGKGAACRAGVARSSGKHVLLTDADLSTPITEIARLEAALPPSGLAIGSRAVAGADIERRQPLYRVAMGKTFNRIIWLLGARGIHDTQCGFKLIDGGVARELFADILTDGFAFDVELLWLAQQRGYPVAEVGVRWSNSPDSRVDPLIDPPRMIRDILRFRRHHAISRGR